MSPEQEQQNSQQGQADEYKKGWKDFYFELMKKYHSK